MAFDVQRDFFHTHLAHFNVIAEPDDVQEAVGPHEHRFTELAFVLRGSADHYSPLGIKSIARGDVVVIGQGAWHSYHNPQQFMIYNCYISGDVFNHSLEGFGNHPALTRLIPPHNRPLMSDKVFEGGLSETAISTCQNHLDEIFRLTRPYFPIGNMMRSYNLEEKQNNRPINDISLSVKVMAHLLFLLDEIAINNPDDITIGQEENDMVTHPAVQRVIELLVGNTAHEWTLVELATTLHMDKSYLGRLFKKATGMSPLSYLSRYRAEQAAKLLVISKQPISEIGQQVGWPEPSYFAERFRAHFGISPREYRACQVAPPLSAASEMRMQQN